jgi:hypothetical protein
VQIGFKSISFQTILEKIINALSTTALEIRCSISAQALIAKRNAIKIK